EARRVPWDRHHEVLEAETVVSALAIGGAEAVAAQWRETASLPRPGVLLDVLYDPWPAPIASVVAAAGGEVADGLEVLAHQADMQLRSMLGVPAAPVPRMLAAARQELSRTTGDRRPLATTGACPHGKACVKRAVSHRLRWSPARPHEGHDGAVARG